MICESNYCPAWCVQYENCCVPPLLQVSAGCPVVCECPAGPPSCPPGVSSVPDGCGCCKVCAAQLNQDCHEGRPCDHHKGLECNYGNDVGRTHGICRGKDGILGVWSLGLSEGMCNFRVEGDLASWPGVSL